MTTPMPPRFRTTAAAWLACAVALLGGLGAAAARAEEAGEDVDSNLRLSCLGRSQMGFQVLSLPSFFAPAKKEGRRSGEFRRAIAEKASAARE